MRNRFGLLAGFLVISTIVFAQSANENRANSTTNSKYWTPEKGQWMEDSDAPGTYGMNVTGSAETGEWVNGSSPRSADRDCSGRDSWYRDVFRSLTRRPNRPPFELYLAAPDLRRGRIRAGDKHVADSS